MVPEHRCTDPACRVRLTLHVDGANTYGDLHVCGFATERTATDVGMDFADALRARHPGAEVSAVVEKLARQARPDAATLREQIAKALWYADGALTKWPPKSSQDADQQRHRANVVVAVLAEHGLVEGSE